MLYEEEPHPWWFEAGIPAVLIDMLIARGLDAVALEDMVCTGDMLSSFDVDDVVLETLLFQIGCVTITSTEDLGGRTFYRLGCPNREVRQSLRGLLLRGSAAEPS